ncbi:MAG TPA: alanine racemase [Lachnospiraceae bacterium]|nr:alanine racemase [Lachnospiraceae bacterium]
MYNYDRVCAEINLDAIVNNVINMKNNMEEKAKIIGVIKTDGYGHGAIPIARELTKLDCVYGFATATTEEAIILRKSGIKKPLLILGYTFPYCYSDLVKEEIRPTVFRLDMAKELSNAAIQLNKILKVHIKVDTGMSRVGITPDDIGIEFMKNIIDLPGIEVEGIFTHFSRADEVDKTFSLTQLSSFESFIHRIKEELYLDIPIKHCSNSAGIIELKQANMDCVRAGITIYGLWPSKDVNQNIVALKPALTLKSKIIYIKEVEAMTPISYGGTFVTRKVTKVATIPVGYGDGYPRMLSNRGWVLINGKRASILGRVCMDQFMVDVTNISEVKEGDTAILIGQDGDEIITMEELGDLSGRFNYELACDFGKRIPRVYIKNGKKIAQKDYNDDTYVEYFDSFYR